MPGDVALEMNNLNNYSYTLEFPLHRDQIAVFLPKFLLPSEQQLRPYYSNKPSRGIVLWLEIWMWRMQVFVQFLLLYDFWYRIWFILKMDLFILFENDMFLFGFGFGLVMLPTV